ncbi:glycosyltransferase [Mucilaginibacter sp. AK015]|uniref:glycosyltransferase n=1 Tax=Mucilaginibacter sp. AK015 TaxID=2723072 RepID=UPI00161C154C|nr:glycosyltransferase [Mucilaginibacter sp. AK015]MBB5396048.1 glycosyltransferase involved in cell wall biosynthesis [Mucilaginibacter sp. AK015]
MNILLNLIPVTFGGGLQVAANFIDTVIDHNGYGHNWWIMVAKGDELSNILRRRNYKNTIEVDNSPLKRMWFEKFKINDIIQNNKIDIMYSYGPGIPQDTIPTVVRSAYSNLYYPEIDFWGNWPLKKRIIAKVKDKYRLATTLKADALIFENKGMRSRAIKNFGYNSNNTFFIKPSVSQFNSGEIDKKKIPEKFKGIPADNFNIVMLTAWHKNKNIDLVPYILKELKDEGVTDVNYLISVEADHPYSHTLMAKAKEFGVETNIYLLGRVKVDEVKYLYAVSSASMLLSKLECFSSNIIEAWTYQKPLLLADEEWARSICEDAVIYVDRDDAQQIADKIRQLKTVKGTYKTIVDNGLTQIKTYNTPEQKVIKQIKFLEFVYRNFARHGKKWYLDQSISNNLSDN